MGIRRFLIHGFYDEPTADWLFANRNLSIVLAGGSSTQKFTGYFTVEKVWRNSQRSFLFNYLIFVSFYSLYVRVCVLCLLFFTFIRVHDGRLYHTIGSGPDST